MTQEDKKQLLVDLSARLPYHVRLKVWLKDGTIEEGFLDLEHNYADVLRDAFYYNEIKDIKPYLRPMSSMTEKEKDEMFGICTLSNCSVNSNWEIVGIEIMSSHPRYGDYYSKDYSAIDWLNKNMFDYRGLIPKGLALEAPEDMYKKEQQ